MYCVFSYGRRVLSSGSIVKVRLFEAWPSKPCFGKYFEITGHMDLDESRYHAYPTGEKVKEEKRIECLQQPLFQVEREGP